MVRFHTPEPTARELEERGLAIFPALLSEELCDALVDALARRFAEAQGAIGADGFVLRDALDVCPRAAEAVLHPRVVALVRAYLGEDLRLEALAAIVSDRRRPFMPWHAHSGGVDQERVKRLGEPPPSSPRRAMILAYPSGCEADAGPLLCMPRAFADARALLGAPNDPDWPGAIEIQAPRGTVVVGDEALFHAVLPQTKDGPRAIVGAYVVRADVATIEPREPSVVRFRSDDPEIRRFLGP